MVPYLAEPVCEINSCVVRKFNSLLCVVNLSNMDVSFVWLQLFILIHFCNGLHRTQLVTLIHFCNGLHRTQLFILIHFCNGLHRTQLFHSIVLLENKIRTLLKSSVKFSNYFIVI